MIKDLTLALRKMLEDSGVQEVVLTRPTTENQSEEKQVSLFLYDIRENVELRSNEFTVERQDGKVISHLSPMRINCSYLVTVSSKNNEVGLLEEHELLSQILQVFASHSTLPESALANNSVLKKQEPPIPIMTAHADTLRNLGEFWTAMGEKLRASISVTATLSLPVREDISAPMITTLQGDFDVQCEGVRESWMQIGGRVIDSEGKGVPSALVDVVDTNNQQVLLRVTSDQEGYFVLSRVLPGTHPVRVTAMGYEPQNQDLRVPGNSEDYKICLMSLAST